jgi:hypothetical protein
MNRRHHEEQNSVDLENPGSQAKPVHVRHPQ